MSRRRETRRKPGARARRGTPLVMVAVIACLLGTVAACGGESNSNRSDRITNPGRPGSTTAALGAVRFEHVRIQRPSNEVHAADTNAALFLTIANHGNRDDTLTTVSSPDATSVVLRKGSAQQGSGAPTLPITRRSTTSLQTPAGVHFELVGLKSDIQQGQAVSVTFQFQSAGSVTIRVPVQVIDHAVVPGPASASPSA